LKPWILLNARILSRAAGPGCRLPDKALGSAIEALLRLTRRRRRRRLAVIRCKHHVLPPFAFSPRPATPRSTTTLSGIVCAVPDS
jgi:hypothetical protein